MYSYTVFSLLFQYMNHNYFLLGVNALALVCKLMILTKLLWRWCYEKRKNVPSVFLCVVLASAAFIDFSWVCVLCKRIWHLIAWQPFVCFIARCAWLMFIVQYHGMVLLLRSLVTNSYKKSLFQYKIFLFITGSFAILFLGFPLLGWDLFLKPYYTSAEHITRHLCTIYLLLILMPFHVWITLKDLQKKELPVIINKQCSLFIWGLMIPYLLSDIISMNPIQISYLKPFIQNPAFIGIATLILTYLLYFCMKRILNIRFLERELPKVPRPLEERFDDYHRTFFSSLEGVSNDYDIAHLVRFFIAHILYVDPECVHLFVRSHLFESGDESSAKITPLIHSIEVQLGMYGAQFMAYLAQEKYLFFDDTHFVNFYEPKLERAQALELLTTTGTVVFVPLFAESELSGYIVVKKGTGKQRLYDAIDRDRLIISATHLALVIAHLHEKEQRCLYEKNKTLTRMVMYLNQHLAHLKETLQTFLHPAQSKQLAIFYYKSRQFFAAHTDAEKLLGVDLNTDVGHEAVQACMQLVQQVQEFRSRQSTVTTSVDGKRFLVIAFLEAEQKQIVLVVISCDLSDIVSAHLGQLPSMNDWDYLLSLQATKLGEKLNTFLPGRTKGLISLKIALFQKIEQKKPLFVVCDTDDISLIAHLVHEVTGRAHKVEIIDPLVHHEYALKIFGKKWPYGMAQGDDPLLKKLDGGTLCIANSHTLSSDVQTQLVRYMQDGQFKKVGGSALCQSDVLLIFMVPYALYGDMREGPESFRALAEKEQLIIPSPTLMEEADLRALIEGYSMQALRTEIKMPLFTLSEYDIRKIVAHHPASLTELKNRVVNALKAKHKDTMPDTSFIFDPAFLLVDQTLATAARLGKNALKQKQIMAVLWLRFDKNQSQIAKFLGVERSSVHRRVKQYNLT